MRLRANQDVAAGLLFLAFGLAALYFGSEYRPGTSLRMGPGYFPRILAWLLMGLGVFIGVRGLFMRSEPLTRWYLRPLILILLALLAFRYTIENFGIMTAVAVAVGLASLSGDEFKARDVAILIVVLAGGSAVLFVRLLGLPMKIWPW